MDDITRRIKELERKIYSHKMTIIAVRIFYDWQIKLIKKEINEFEQEKETLMIENTI